MEQSDKHEIGSLKNLEEDSQAKPPPDPEEVEMAELKEDQEQEQVSEQPSIQFAPWEEDSQVQESTRIPLNQVQPFTDSILNEVGKDDEPVTIDKDNFFGDTKPVGLLSNLMESGAKPANPLARSLSVKMNSIEEQQVSYKSLRNHIDLHHPTKLDESRGKQVPFSICDKLGRLHIFHCFGRCCPQKITPMARQLGVGPALFLMSTKALAVLFLVLALINIPVLKQINDGSRIQSEVERESESITDFFSKETIGNVGKPELACAITKPISKEKLLEFYSDEYYTPSLLTPEETPDLKFNCPSGKKLMRFTEIQLVRNEKVGCKMRENEPAKFEKSMVMDSRCMFDPYRWTVVEDESKYYIAYSHWIKTCMHKASCEVPGLQYLSVTYQLCKRGQITEIIEKEEEEQFKVLIQAECISEEGGAEMRLVYSIVLTDVLIVAILAIFTWWLQYSSEKYAESFANQTLEMNDFAVRVRPLPHQSLYNRNDEVLRVNLIKHFQGVVREEYIYERRRQLEDEEGEKLTIEEVEKVVAEELASKKGLNPLPWEVADVCVGKRSMGEVKYLNKLAEIRSQFTKAQIKLQRSKGFLQKTKMLILKQTFVKMFELEREKYWRKKEEMEKESEDPEIAYAYVVFRGMRATDLVLQAYDVGFVKRIMTMSCLGKVCCKKSRAKVESLYVYEKWPEVIRACQPEFIQPENLAFSATSRFGRQLITWLVAVIIMLVTTAAIILMRDLIVMFQSKFPADYDCPEILAPEHALADHNRSVKDRLGLMHCFCYNLATTEKSFTFQFDPKDPSSHYCKYWAANFATVNLISIATSIGMAVLNIGACTIFERMASFEKNHTTTEETASSFTKIAFLQYINISIVLLIVNFNYFEDSSLSFLPIFNGEFEDFDVQWYSQIGKTLCMTLFIQIFSPHASKLAAPVIQLFKRYKDRGYTNKLKIKDPDGDTDVNTQLLLQGEVNELYTGSQVSIQYIYAQNFTYLWCALTFSTGMPFLYLLGFLYFFIFYWVYKGLLLKFHMRSTQFNEELPLKSIKLIFLGMVLHIAFGCQMLSYMTYESTLGNDDFYTYFLNRYATDGGGYHILLLFFCLVFWLLKSTLAPVLYKCCRGVLCMCCRPRRILDAIDMEEYSDDIFKDIQLFYLKRLYAKASFERERYHAYLDSTKGAEKDDDHIAFLDRRVSQIEFIIDDHLSALYGGKEDPATPSEDMSYRDKIKHLITKKDQIPRGGDGAAPRLRLEGLVQSYDVFESAQFKKAQAVKDILKDNPDYSLS